MKSIKRYSALLLFATIIISLVSYSLMEPSPRLATEPTKGGNTQSSNIILANPLSQLQPPPVASFKGTDIDGRLAIDHLGNLIVGKNLKDMFDYFLSSFGERSIAAILVSLKNHIYQQLDEPARSQALEILYSYFSYKNALLELEAPLDEGNADILKGKKIASFKERLLAIKSLRQNHFSDDVNQAFFSHTEQYDQYTLRRMEINHNELLSVSEKQIFLLEAAQLLPEDVLKLKQASSKHLSLKAKQVAMKDATQEEIFNMRAQEVGAEAATRLSKLDHKRTQWQQRIKDYQYEQNIILQSGLSTQDQTRALQQLKENRFNKNEIRRLRALESISSNP
ncbi:MAG: lipase secretion chaperone [Bermanella sp.]